MLVLDRNGYNHKFSDKTNSRSVRLDGGSQTGITLARAAMALFREHGELPCRSVGLRAVRLKEGRGSVQLDMFSQAEEEMRLCGIEEILSSICSRFGENAITRASLVGKEKGFSPGFSLPSP